MDWRSGVARGNAKKCYFSVSDRMKKRHPALTVVCSETKAMMETILESYESPSNSESKASQSNTRELREP